MEVGIQLSIIAKGYQYLNEITLLQIVNTWLYVSVWSVGGIFLLVLNL
jgi:hypothetical protein